MEHSVEDDVKGSMKNSKTNAKVTESSHCDITSLQHRRYNIRPNIHYGESILRHEDVETMVKH